MYLTILDDLNINWLDQGNIEFSHVSMKYADNDPLVLKDVSFSIKPREKVTRPSK